MGKIMIRDGVGYSRTFSKRALQQIMAVLRPMFIFVCTVVHYPLDIYQSLVSSSSGSLLSDLTTTVVCFLSQSLGIEMQTLDLPPSNSGFHFLTSNGSVTLTHYLEVECSLVWYWLPRDLPHPCPCCPVR